MDERTHLIVGAGASQGIFGEAFTDPALLGADQALPHLTFYDTNREITVEEGLPHLNAAWQRGEVEFVHQLPVGEPFDVAIIATASAQRAAATQTVLDAHPDRPPFFILEKPLAATQAELAWLHRLAPHIQPAAISNEPYLFSEGVKALISYADKQAKADNPLREVWAWSSKLRRKRKSHGDLGIFGIELPHTYGAASLLAGEALGLQPEHAEENVYFADVDDVEGNDGNYMRFKRNNLTIHVAQGLGQFVMNREGKIKWNERPPRTRRVGMRFDDDCYIELDIERAFDRFCPSFPEMPSQLLGHSILGSITPKASKWELSQ